MIRIAGAPGNEEGGRFLIRSRVRIGGGGVEGGVFARRYLWLHWGPGEKNEGLPRERANTHTHTHSDIDRFLQP